MRCEQPIEEQQAIPLLMSKLESWVRIFVRIDNNTTFSSFIPDVTRAEKNAPELIKGLQSMIEQKGEPSRNKQQGKGKPAAAMSTEAKESSPNAPAPQRSRQGQDNRNRPSLEEIKNRKHSFTKESVPKLFERLMKKGLDLPRIKRPNQVGKTDDPKYCPYHRIVSHPIEECWIFNEWLETQHQRGTIQLPTSALQKPPAAHSYHITVGVPVNEAE